MLEQLNRINLLFDIYGPLLTDRQQETLQLYFSENYSLAEIALVFKTSRQAVYDLIQRSLASMEKLEEKLGLYRLFNEQQELLDEAEMILSSGEPANGELARLKEILGCLRLSNEQ